MKYLKILGLAVVAAMPMMAFVGAGSASATVLCATTTTPCGTGWHVDHLDFTQVKETSMLIKSTGGFSESTCTGTDITVTKKSTGSATTTWVGSVGKSGWTITTCAQTTHTLEGGEGEIHHITGTDNGAVTVRGFKVTTITPVGSCVYGAGAGIHLGTLTGGHPAVMHVEAVVERQAGSAFFCPADTVWEATYQLTSHTKLYVRPS